MIKLPAELVVRLRGPYEGMRVCVTGGAGFIGGHLVDALQALGATVWVIDDLSNADASHLAGMMDLAPDQVNFIHGSILEDAALRTAVTDAHVIFHLAAVGSVPRSISDPERSWIVNASGTVRVLEAARKAGSKRVVFAGSSSVYGDDPDLPKVEGKPPRPRSPYAASKAAAEHACLAWSSSYGLDTVSLRYFNVFGPRQSPESEYAAVIPRFASRLLAGERPVIFGDGQQSRDFTYVANAVLATLLAGSCESPLRGEVINVGAGKRTTLLELAALMAELCIDDGRAITAEPEHRPMRPGDVMHSLADISKAATILGYKPIVGLKQGLADTIAWQRGLPASKPDSA
ncbi:MAG: NAD-dependent epimerase/dehydratase family protein [Phycisphaeraceae bacterium]|nr:NAD-dependent epimerase/dehydratase family protein [Phycisphaeraceae bacterium]MCW5754149.1 NAD-dependent epimerase/dehydratase family protein [Phycisphaeraceae bacterium]